MKGIISAVRKNSAAASAGIRAGEKLLAVNDVPVKDIIELSFLACECEPVLELENENGARRLVSVEKDPDEELGLEFAEAVFDGVRTCRNKCLFCFVDQMIPGMRRSLYVRDDDYRLSFLYGNFVTLTNLSEEDIERIIRFHLSPLYVSVHATRGDVRCKLMGNRFADQLFDKLDPLLDAGIEVHAQIVCCPGYNDGDVLEQSFFDLYARAPRVRTMAVVPVGLTKQREGLTQLRTFTQEEARALIERFKDHQRICRIESGKNFMYFADEFYLLAGMEVPPASAYDGFPQLENGIGLVRDFLEEWGSALALSRAKKAQDPALILVGASFFKVLEPLVEKLNRAYHAQHRLLPIENDFFGPQVNVTGLLTAGDILREACRERVGRLILPGVVLNKDDLFLDDVSLESFRKAYSGEVQVAGGARELAELLLRD